MRLYRQITKKHGKAIQSKKWYADVRIPPKGQNPAARFALPLYESEDKSRRFTEKLDVMIGQYESGFGYDSTIQRWVNQQTGQMIGRFAKWGLLDIARAEANKTINTHLDEWRESLVAEGTSPRHADQNRQRVKRIFTEAGFDTLSDIDGDKTMLAIGQLKAAINRKNKETDKIELQETGPASSNSKLHHLRACKQFTKWLRRNSRILVNPLEHLTIKNVRVETERRALSPDELSYLLDHVESSKPSWGIPGPRRALIYELAAYTGLRRNEISSLKRTSFNFTGLSVKVEAKDTKNKKPALLPLKPALMDKIKRHLSDKLPAAQCFPLPDATSKMLKKDMASARDAWIAEVKDNPDEHIQRTDSDFLKIETHEGKADFHSLRTTFCTMLAAQGVPLKVAMDLMRHSDVNLTMKIYSRSTSDQAKSAIAALPDLSNGRKTKQA